MRINIGPQSVRDTPISSTIRLSRVADGATFQDGRIRVGENSGLSARVSGLPYNGAAGDAHPPER